MLGTYWRDLKGDDLKRNTALSMDSVNDFITLVLTTYNMDRNCHVRSNQSLSLKNSLSFNNC